ncbi:MAG: response regulator [Candidatus Omnitrophica bacterium]|nr:response regulator [Candidatus Omnitrophota bacterium]MCB9721518.1 response regulator [Candidatus Omnitrophota bacterium]
MSYFEPTLRDTCGRKILSVLITAVFIWGTIVPPVPARAAQPATVLDLPAPGTRVQPAGRFMPALIRGMRLDEGNPLKLEFVIHPGDVSADDAAFRDESDKLIKYFLAALTTPEDQLWVNLSPYEADRIIPADFGRTRLGRDMLAQDYLLKQLTASLMYPEEDLGREFWERVYRKAQARFGTTAIPMNTFNKVWIVPQTATVYVHDGAVFVVDSHLRVMLESDYLSLAEHPAESGTSDGDSGITADIVREVLIPEIEREVNTGRTFAPLRQIFSAVVLASWYKQNLRESFLGQVYVDRARTDGVDTADADINRKIYRQYVAAFEKGVYDYIREDYDPVTRHTVPRKYFSGGVQAQVQVATDESMLSRQRLRDTLQGARTVVVMLDRFQAERLSDGTGLTQPRDGAMLSKNEFDRRLGRATAEVEWRAIRSLGLKEELLATLPRYNLWDEARDRLPGDLQRGPLRPRQRYETAAQLVAIVKRLDALIDAAPKQKESLYEQIMLYTFLYESNTDNFRGMRPAELLRAVLDAVTETDRAARTLVLLNNVIGYGIIAEGETVAGLARKLTSHPRNWPERNGRHFEPREADGRKPLVLVVDDNFSEVEKLIARIEEEGYEVAVADSGLAGLASVGQRRPDLVITDVSMPDMNGIQFTRALGETYPDLPVIVRDNQLGNGHWFPTRLSNFVITAFPNVIGVPGKSDEGLKTMNLLRLYLPARVRLAGNVRVVMERANTSVRALYLNRKFDRDSLRIMLSQIESIADAMNVVNFEGQREARLEKAGGYEKGFVLLRERDPDTGEVTEDNGPAGRLLRDNTLQPRINDGRVRQGDWITVTGNALREALHAKLQEEFEDVMTETQRVMDGEEHRRERMTVVMTNFMDAVYALQAMDESDAALLVRSARDLNRVGRETPVAVLPFAIVGSQRRDMILEEAFRRGLGRVKVTSTESPYGMESYLIFDRGAVDTILANKTFADALMYAGVPVTTDDFVDFLASGRDRFIMNRDAAAVIKHALGTVLPGNTLDVVIADELADLAGPLSRPWVTGNTVVQVIDALRLAMDVGIHKLERDKLVEGLDPEDREALDRRLIRLQDLRAQLFTRDGEFDFARAHLFVNNISARAMDQEVTASDRILIAPNGNPAMAVYPDPVRRSDIDTTSDRTVQPEAPGSAAADNLADRDADKFLSTADLVFRTLYVNRQFDARSLITMSKNARAVAEMFGIQKIHAIRRARFDKAGGYEKGYVLLRERNPQTGEIAEDNGEDGRLLRDNTLQPRIDDGRVRDGDWKVVAGEQKRSALRRKLKEEFDDIMTEARRVLKGDAARRERLTVVITNFLEAIVALQTPDQAVIVSADDEDLATLFDQLAAAFGNALRSGFRPDEAVKISRRAFLGVAVVGFCSACTAPGLTAGRAAGVPRPVSSNRYEDLTVAEIQELYMSTAYQADARRREVFGPFIAEYRQQNTLDTDEIFRRAGGIPFETLLSNLGLRDRSKDYPLDEAVESARVLGSMIRPVLPDLLFLDSGTDLSARGTYRPKYATHPILPDAVLQAYVNGLSDLAPLLNSAQRSSRVLAALALTRIHHYAAPNLRVSEFLLENVDRTKVIPALEQALTSPEPLVRKVAVDMLWELGVREVRPGMAALFDGIKQVDLDKVVRLTEWMDSGSAGYDYWDLGLYPLLRFSRNKALLSDADRDIIRAFNRIILEHVERIHRNGRYTLGNDWIFNARDLMKEILDNALLTEDTKGGIDLNPANYELRTQGEWEFTPTYFTPQELHNININGFVPVIINISPLIDIPLLLGMTGTDAVGPLSRR